jgi:23S rRNA (uridine2552-2'-O)-methyltransferase
MAKSKSSAQWLRRHVTDAYVHRAKEQGYRSRAAFKLIEIDSRERLLRPGARVVDLGAAPGGWSQVAARRTAPGGRVVAIDLLPIAPISGVTIIQGDFLDEPARRSIVEALGGEADLVLSDLSPNLSGIAAADQARMAELVEQAALFAVSVLGGKGAFVCKIFHGGAFDGVLAELKRSFRSVAVRKPAASRGESRETYLFAREPKTP